MVKATELGGGATWHSQEFTSSGTFTVPFGVGRLYVTGCAGGGGGINAYGVPGGGGGEGAYSTIMTVTSNQVLNITIGSGGAGGAGQSNVNNPGADGGDTIIGTMVLLGGKGGGNGHFGGGKSTSGPVFQLKGFITGADAGQNLLPYSRGVPNNPTNAYMAGAAGMFGNGGNSELSGTPKTPATSAAPNSGAGGGGGLGASNDANPGGDGGSGRVILEWQQ